MTLEPAVTMDDITLREKDHFVSVVSHQIRTPLTVIRGYAQLLQRRPNALDTETQRVLRIMDRKITELSSLIDDLVDLSRMELSQFTCDMQPVQYTALVDSVVSDHVELSPSVNVSLSVPDCTVMGDSRRLEQVLHNLVDNAIKHGPCGGTITVTATLTGDKVVTNVADDGPALAPPHRDEIFARFVRLPRAPAALNAGLGIGLYVCSQILNAHAERIWIEDVDHFSIAFSLARANYADGASPSRSHVSVA